MRIRMPAITLLLCMTAACGLSCGEKGKPATNRPANPPANGVQTEVPTLPIDEMPQVVRSAPVTYPEDARARGEEGIVYVKAFVGEDGTVRQVTTDTLKPAPPALEKAALEAVKHWTFTPAKLKGKPVEVWIVVPVSFKLQ